jgi:hypothetical protein
MAIRAPRALFHRQVKLTNQQFLKPGECLPAFMARGGQEYSPTAFAISVTPEEVHLESLLYGRYDRIYPGGCTEYNRLKLLKNPAYITIPPAKYDDNPQAKDITIAIPRPQADGRGGSGMSSRPPMPKICAQSTIKCPDAIPWVSPKVHCNNPFATW